MTDASAATVDSAYVLTVASVLIILSRTILRQLKHEAFKLDDYLMLLAIVLAGFNCAVYPITVSIKGPTPQINTSRED